MYYGNCVRTKGPQNMWLADIADFMRIGQEYNDQSRWVEELNYAAILWR
jgi:hypothetical protein